MGCAPRVPELSEHVAALGMDCIREALPPGHLLVAVECWRASVAAPGCRDCRRFRQNQSTVRGPLAVIFELQVARDASRPLISKSTHRGHHDEMLECD